MDVEGWLRSLGLSQYDAAFQQNSIDSEILPALTADDLKELGVVSVGHRRKLLAAIEELVRPQVTAIRTKPPAVSALATDDVGERRQLSVMFCDLVGSTALSASFDPEDLRDILGAYHRCCADLIERHGGFVAKYMGDGVLSYFGYPSAHEHDAERAVAAGLALVAAVPDLATAAAGPLQVRVGIATGIVVVGDRLGSGESQERSIVGDTPNLAARLQTIAEPGNVIIAEETRRFLGNLFDLQDLGTRSLKGVSSPTRVWAALRATSVESRFDALHAHGVTELVGREDELELLLRRWTSAKAGHGQIALLSGEAGIGKSRLTAAFLERLANEPHTPMRYFCSPQHEESALYPIIRHLERAAGFAYDDEPTTKLQRLETLLATSLTPREDAELIAELLSIPGESYPVLNLTPPQRRQKTMDLLLAQVEARSGEKPILMIFEDAHWTDPTSLELLDRLVERIPRLRVLLIVTFRPEFVSSWIGRPHVTVLAINRLTSEKVSALVDRVAGDHQLPTSIRHDIVERADGVPLFVEEMTKAVLETLDEDGGVSAMGRVPSSKLSVPASLHASLMARLDRLAGAKPIAQVGAAIGREFSYDLLVLVAQEAKLDIDAALDRLVEAGLMFRQGSQLAATYLFKHALVQDAAYGTLLRQPRRALHARIVEALESRFPETAEARPEILAHHCTEAALMEKAVGFGRKAAEQSLARSALIEAEAQFVRGLRQIVALPSTPALRGEQIKLQVGLASVLMPIKGYAAEETKAALAQAQLLIKQAEALGEHPEDPLAPYAILYGLFAANYLHFNGRALCDLAEQFLSLARKQTASLPLMMGHRLMGVSLMNTGDLPEGRAHLDRAISLYDPLDHRVIAARFASDSTVYPWRSWALWLLGFFDAAQADVESTLRDLRFGGHAPSLMFGLNITLITLVQCGAYEKATALADELISLATEKGAIFWRACGLQHQMCLLAVTGNAAKAVSLMAPTIAAFQATGARAWTPYVLSIMASAHVTLGLLADAKRLVDEAVTAVKCSGEKWFEAEVYRTKGEIERVLHGGDAATARSSFERALECARSQQAQTLELRAAMSLARLHRDQGDFAQARDLLVSSYNRFTEGFDTIDLRRARALLDEFA